MSGKKVQRPCAVCGKECAPYQRTTDGTYLHDACAYAVTPTRVLASRDPKEEA